MRVAVHASHRAIEHYLYSLLPECTFYRSGPDGGMVLRELPENCVNLGGFKRVLANKPHVAIARDAGHVEQYREAGIPTLWYLSGPPKPAEKNSRREYFRMCQGIVAYSDYHAELWAKDETGLPRFHICHYPIDTDVFKNYDGSCRRALMIATMNMQWWAGHGGDWKGRWLLVDCLKAGIPFQLIGFNNEDDEELADANPFAIDSEDRMVGVMRQHRVYAHTGSFLCRSPLEAAAIGLPVVIRLTEYTHYLDELPHLQGVFRAFDQKEFMAAVQFFLENPEEARAFGQRGREQIKKHFSPELVHDQWLRALEGTASA